MKKYHIISFLCLLGISLSLFTGCHKKPVETTETSVDPLLQVTPATLDLSGGTTGTSPVWDIEESESSVESSTATDTSETVDPAMTQEQIGNDVSYLNNNPSTTPVPNTMTNLDLAKETYPTDGGYVTYPLAHMDYPKIGYHSYDDITELGIVYLNITNLSINTNGEIIITGSYYQYDENYNPTEISLTACLSGIRCYGNEPEADSIKEYCRNALQYVILDAGDGDCGLWIELGEVDEEKDITYVYGWLQDASGDFYSLQEYLLVYGYVEPYITNNYIKYQTYYNQYPPLYRPW